MFRNQCRGLRCSVSATLVVGGFVVVACTSEGSQESRSRGGDVGAESSSDGAVADAATLCTDDGPLCDGSSDSCRYVPDDPTSGCTESTDTQGLCPAFAPRLFSCAAAVPLHCCLNPGIAGFVDGPVFRCCS